MFVKLIAKLSPDPPVLGELEGLQAVLWDEDPLKDDKLSEAIVRDGTAEFLIDLSDASSADSPFERLPDLYVTVLDASGRQSFRSGTHRNVDFTQRDPVSNDRKTTLQLVFT